MTNTEFLNLSLPEPIDKIDINVINNDFKALEKSAEKHAIAQEITIDETAIIKGVIGPYIEIENMTEEIVEVDIADEILLLQKDDKRKIRTISAENVAVATSGLVKIKYFTNAKHYVDENYYSKEKIDELIEDVDVEVDAKLSESSENPVQNKVVTAELAQRLTQQETIALVVEKVAEIVAGAPEDFDTLKELSDWLLQHESSAAAMNTAIQKNKTDIETANTNISKNAEDIATANTNIQKNVDDITATKNDIAMNKSTLGVQCKNLCENQIQTQIYNGVSVTRNEDGSLTLNGTSTNTSIVFLNILSTTDIKKYTGKKLIISGIGLSGCRYQFDVRKSDNSKLYEKNITEDDMLVEVPNGAYLIALRFLIEVNKTYDSLTLYPMIRYAEIADGTYESYKPDTNKRLSMLETLSDVVYKCDESYWCNYDGYVLRVGNQAHLNLTATFKRNCEAWVGSIVKLPFKVKTPDNSNRYTIKQVQTDGRETSIYLQNGGTTFFTSTAFQKGDVFVIPPMILDMYVEETATTEGGE